MIKTAADIMYIICFYIGFSIIIKRRYYKDTGYKRALLKVTLAAIWCLQVQINYDRLK